MDVRSLARQLDIASERVLRKAEELARLISVRCPAGLPTGDSCKYAACLALACKLNHENFNKDKAIKLCGSTEKIYLMTFSALQNVLGIRLQVPISEMASHIGCSHLLDKAQQILQMYKDKFIAALPENRRAHADFSSPVFGAVALYLCSKQAKIEIQKKKLLDLIDTGLEEFTKVCTSMSELCFEDNANQSPAKKIRKPVIIRQQNTPQQQALEAVPSFDKKRSTSQLNDCLLTVPSDGQEEDSDLDDEELIDNVEGVVPGFQMSKRRKQKEDYESWKAKVMTQPKLPANPLKPMKQVALSFVASPKS